ncbi:SdpI family protein [Candidatus Shapirobacteria bacterium]|nr:SdpI family protein [Candidatus Shapirobacteria bacterium]
MKKFIPPLIILLSFALAIISFPYLPPTIVTHWGINNNVDGYSSKSFGLFFLPTLLILLYFLFLFLPKTDPYKHNFAQFKKYYDNFVNLVFVFLFYIYFLTIAWNYGFEFNLTQFLLPALSLIFYYAGVLNQKARRNWFVGIRTPWTLSSESVWNQTHQVGGKLFKLSALTSLLGVFWPTLSVYFLMVPLFGSVIFVFVYSYFLYRREND